MNQSCLYADEDQDSLFGSPPPSPARGRSPPQEIPVAGREIGPVIAVPSTGVGRKNVGTIALPGSHMSCAELPADLPASSLSSHDSMSIAGPSSAETLTLVHTPAVTSRSPTRSVPSRASSAASAIPSASTRKRRTSKSKSATPIPSAPPITLPGPNEPTPPNFLRSQTSLLGVAGLVGCVKPAQLYIHGPQPTPVQHARSHSPNRGSTPTHPIVLDDDQDAPNTVRRPRSELQMPQRLDQLDPEVLHSNIMNSLSKEKNIFPILESLVKLFGGEPQVPSASPPPQPFARPYGHSIFNVQSSPVDPLSPPVTSTITPAIPPPKRRKLKHVPAGAVDWDVPFPFAVGEGPEAYRDNWARDRAKQLVTQLLELMQNAAKRAAIKTAKSGETSSKGRTQVRNHQMSRSASVETQAGQINSTQRNVCQISLSISPNVEAATTETPVDSLYHYRGLLKSPDTIRLPVSRSRDRMSVDLEGAVEGGGSGIHCDYSTFEEWLSQLQHFVPLEPNAPTPEPDRGTRPSTPLDLSASSPMLDIHVPTQQAIREEAIDPTLLAMSQQSDSTPRSQSPTLPTSPLTSGDIPQVLDTSPVLPALAHSPRTSLSSIIEPLTPLSEVFTGVPASTIDAVYDPPDHQPIQKDHPVRLGNRIPATAPSSSATEPNDPPRIPAAQKGKERADGSIASATPSESNRSTPSAVSTLKGALDKQATLERAREQRRQLVAEIERAKIEMWETTIENAVLVHLTRDTSL